jgi:hypothetical protein
MEDLDEAPVRPLDAFENGALERLREGEDLVYEETDRSVHMVGAIRAVQQCLECHQTQRGALLGAFTYELR